MKKLLTLTFVLLSASLALATGQIQTAVKNAENYFLGLDGYVVEAGDTGVIVDLGIPKRITPGLILTVYREGTPIVHPVSGVVLGAKQEIAGKLVVQSVFENFSITQKQGVFDVAAGDKVFVERPVKIILDTEGMAEADIIVLNSVIQASPVFTVTADAEYTLSVSRFGSVISSQISQNGNIIYSDTIVEDIAAATAAVNGLKFEVEAELPKGKYFSMSVGKIYPDKDELFLVASQDDEVHLFNLSDTFNKIGEIKGKFNDIASVDIADLDGDGIGEIFISNVFRRTYAQSFVYKYDGKNFTLVQDKIEFIMRSITGADGERRIVGQELNNGGGYKGEIFYVAYADGRYTKGEVILGTAGKQVLGFNMLPVADSGDMLMLGIDQSSRFSISTFKGAEYTATTEFFGDTSRRFSPSDVEDAEELVANVAKQIHARPRMEVVADNTFILVKNNLYSRAFSNSPVFSSSSFGIYRYEYTKMEKLYIIDEQEPFISDIYTYTKDDVQYLLVLTTSNKVGFFKDPTKIARYRISLAN